MDRLYVVTRADMPPGDQGTQSIHAASSFAVDYPELHRTWHLNGKNLIWLAAPDEAALRALFDHLTVEKSYFAEPDMGDELTAVAFSGAARKLVSSLPKALKDPTRLVDLGR